MKIGMGILDKIIILDVLLATERTKVVFSAAAGVEGAVGPYNIATTIVYKDVKANIGGAYGNFTGNIYHK